VKRVHVTIDEALWREDEACAAIPSESKEMEVGTAMMKIADDEELSADMEEAEARPAEAIIQAWRQLRRALQRPSPSEDNLLATR
jgi:hypothetical protein